MTLVATTTPVAIAACGRSIVSLPGILVRRRSAAVTCVQIRQTAIAAATKPRTEHLTPQLFDALLHHDQNDDTDQHRHTDSPDQKAQLSLRNRSNADMGGRR